MKHEFPKMLFKQGHQPVTVHNQKEQEEHKGWSETPVDAPKDKGDAVNYAVGTPEVASAHTPEPVLLATKELGADPKKGAEPHKGTKQ